MLSSDGGRDVSTLENCPICVTTDTIVRYNQIRVGKLYLKALWRGNEQFRHDCCYMSLTRHYVFTTLLPQCDSWMSHRIDHQGRVMLDLSAYWPYGGTESKPPVLENSFVNLSMLVCLCQCCTLLWRGRSQQADRSRQPWPEEQGPRTYPHMFRILPWQTHGYPNHTESGHLTRMWYSSKFRHPIINF